MHMKLEEYNELAQDELTHLVRYATARVYGEGERPSAALAALIRRDRRAEEANRLLSVLPTGSSHSSIRMRALCECLGQLASAFAPWYRGPGAIGLHTRSLLNFEPLDPFQSYLLRRSCSSVAIILHAEKAFDSVEWEFMLSVLRHVDVGDTFLKLVRELYKHPSARVLLRSLVSKPIVISRGTGQGCLHSPLLYALVAEPLACALCEYHAYCEIRSPTLQITNFSVRQ
ncbi:hypothetical protein NDU88_009841 [Pleurodeles waltl]|uniref:Reverse transcriptase domain-containing protein n=1 Tax=Pleurodeles waltl TaxID=8319 RepID=A0AAV7RX96_PLEWA|nr:hypothetical protein NDU88_009841 [Pleurodeles waltl]